MTSRFFENAVAEYVLLNEGVEYNDIVLRRTLANSRMLSSDVSAGFDPMYEDVYEKRNAAFLARGPVFNKYTGSGGKSGSNDANPEYIAQLRQIMEEAGVNFRQAWSCWRRRRLERSLIWWVYMEWKSLTVVSCMLGMHAPWETTSKADVQPWGCKMLWSILKSRILRCGNIIYKKLSTKKVTQWGAEYRTSLRHFLCITFPFFAVPQGIGNAFDWRGIGRRRHPGGDPELFGKIWKRAVRKEMCNLGKIHGSVAKIISFALWIFILLKWSITPQSSCSWNRDWRADQMENVSQISLTVSFRRYEIPKNFRISLSRSCSSGFFFRRRFVHLRGHIPGGLVFTDQSDQE